MCQLIQASKRIREMGKQTHPLSSAAVASPLTLLKLAPGILELRPIQSIPRSCDPRVLTYHRCLPALTADRELDRIAGSSILVMKSISCLGRME